jgi:hypothetical protein
VSEPGTRVTLWDLVRAVNWVNLLSPRVWFSAMITGILAAVLPGMLWEPLMMPVFWVVFVAMLLALAVGPPVRCPDCQSRVKVGAIRCRRCGIALTGGH